MEQDKIELYYDRGNRAIFDNLIARIIKRTNEGSKKAEIEFYNKGQYVYKFLDILKEENKLHIIEVLPWSKLRTFWLKVIELTKYSGTYKAYVEILHYLFGKEVSIAFESRTTDIISGSEPRKAGNLWINISQADSIIQKFIWLTNEERDTLIAYKQENPITGYPLYVTKLIDLSIDIIEQVIDLLTPAGLRTYVNLTL